jgi:hypothetical protein
MTTSKLFNKFGPWAIITGASSGIGEAYAHQLASEKFNLVLVARRSDILQKLGKYLSAKYHIKHLVIQANLSIPEAYQEIITATKDLDIGLLISNAGTGRPGSFLKRTQEDLSQIIHLNTLSHLWLTYHFSKIFSAKGRGGIAITGAMGARNGVPYMAIEAGTKAFVEGLGRSLNYELKSKGVHVTVLVASPTETPVIKKLGFTKENIPAKPITAAHCVKETLEALYINQPTIIPGFKYRFMNAILPGSIGRNMMGRALKQNNNIQ